MQIGACHGRLIITTKVYDSSKQFDACICAKIYSEPKPGNKPAHIGILQGLLKTGDSTCASSFPAKGAWHGTPSSIHLG